ncbi:MAG: YggS family pyridoxal phosphate-dependent enzyme [Pseudonocardia sp.]|nr:YggS family pyridoxal phosphate-dependent enzyme [Pseudonocardia sp.]
MTGNRNRHAELAAALASVRGRIAAACAAAGRSAEDVALLAVTKSRPASDVAILVDLGLREFGENRPQEAAAKAAELAQLRPDIDVRWHLVGRLQRNKVRSVVPWAARVESVDSARLVDALDAAVARARQRAERHHPLPVLLQLSLDGDPSRGGIPLANASALAALVAAAEGLVLRGVMAVAPLGADPNQAFALLAREAARIRAEHPGARVLSAGMTADLEAAIHNGSTCVRVGAALLGERPITSP